MDTASEDSSQRPELPGYDVLDLLGRGATGAVWAVRNSDGVRLAAKVFDADLEQLDYELSVLESLRHDHVVRLQEVVADLSTNPVGTAMIMQLAEGGSLADTLDRRGVLTPGELVTVLCPVARALHDLHGMGLVHGDLSPGNVLLTAAGKPLIADLGMSRLAGHAGDEVWATESWAAPEVLAGGSPVPASDVYSLGAIAWRALTGAPPEPAALRPDLAELAPEVPDELRDLVNAALAHTDSARPLPGEFAIALWQCATPEPAPVQGSPARRAAAAAPASNEADALTRRIRAQAAADSGRHRAAEPAQSGTRIPSKARWLLAGAAVVGGALALGVTGFGNGSSSAPAQAAEHGPSSAAPTRRSSKPAPTGRAAKTPSAKSAAVKPKDAAKALGAHPVHVVQGLAAARAAAWTHGDAGRLGAAELAGSPAYLRDRKDLRTAADQKARYDGLTFTVRSAQVQQGTGDVVHVTAMIDRSAYDVVTAKGQRTVPAAAGQQTDLSVQWTKYGWRVVDWADASAG
ncbi:MAG TPA: protein kinase [Flexivirga sp.]|uniref:serine/threonine-protein kinase n=1 Tax=Flexivirga sp. TaxID=1962927 RepID=UPI002B6ABD3A|nr:protein kinase [Flexivirga sp.]HWC23590.1 protein kinase [Flexivirga sp.]